MIVLIPTRISGQSVKLIFLVILMFASGVFLCLTGAMLFIAPRLVQPMDLFGLLPALFAGWVLFRLGRQLFRKDFEDEDDGGVFSARGFSAWFLFLFMLSFLVGGVFLGSLTVAEEREQRFIEANKPARATLSHASSSSVIPRGLPVAAREAGLRLSAVFYNAKRPSAIVNGATVFIGDHVGDWSVSAISPRSVTVQSPKGGTNLLLLDGR
jgi:hypothetical protein